jgi:glycosyltransferase involved in cell wall biosynthesis
MEQYVYDRASHITCVARPMQEYIGERTRTPVTVVYNGASSSDIVGGDSDNGFQNGHTLLYAGNLGRAQQLDLLIRAWARVRDNDTARSWAVEFLGTGALERDLRELATNLGVSNSITFSRPVSRQEAIRQMSGAAALCVSLRADQAFERTIPSKVFDCMAVGKPVLAGVAGEARTILDSTGANVCYEPGNQQGLEEALKELVQDYPRRRRLARRNAQMVRSSYTRERAVRVLMNVFDDVVADGCVHSPVKGDLVIDHQGSP